jgi:tetratricopeptide (TPR) repeat protein
LQRFGGFLPLLDDLAHNACARPLWSNVRRNFAVTPAHMGSCIKKHIAAIAFLLASPMPAPALDCLPDPDPACVFQQALLRADLAPRPQGQVWGYLTVAYLQKTSGHGDAQSTLTLLGSKLQQRNLTPDEMENVFADALFGYAFQNAWGSHDPDAHLWVGCAAVAMMDQINPTHAKEEPPECTAAAKAEKAAMSARVAATPPDPLAKYMRLTAAGIPANDSELFLIASGSEGRSHLEAEQLWLLVRKFAFRAAEELVASWPEKADRAQGYSYLAVRLARAGEIRAALALVTRQPELRDPKESSYGMVTDIAEIWARAGQGKKVQELLGGRGKVYVDDRPKFLAIAAAVSGDFDLAANQLQTIKDAEDRYFATSDTMQAYLNLGQTSGEDLLAGLPPDLHAGAILGIGLYRARTGDLEGALAMYDRLDAMNPTYLPIDLRAEIAPLLAAMGRAGDALIMAQELGSVETIAEVAAQMK